MQVDFSQNVSDQARLTIEQEIEQWPQGLKDDFEKHGINVAVGKDAAELGIDTTGQGQYDSETKTLYLWENAQDGQTYSSSALKASLNHEAGHAVGMTITNGFPETKTYGNLLHKDLSRLAQDNPEAYANLDPHLKQATEMHNYPASVAHENFAEDFAHYISSDKTDIRTNPDATPRAHAATEHIVDNYRNGLPALDGMDRYSVIHTREHRVTESGLRRPGMGTTIVGDKLVELEERLSQKAEAKKVPSEAQPVAATGHMATAGEAPRSLTEEFGKRAGVIGGLVVGGALIAEGAEAKQVALGVAEATVPGVSSAAALTEGRPAEATLRAIEEIPIAGLAATEVARPLLQGAGVDVDPSIGQMIIDKATQQSPASPEQQEFMRVYDALPNEASPDMPPEVATLAEHKGMISQAEAILDRTKPSDMIARSNAQDTLAAAEGRYSQHYDALAANGGIEHVKEWTAEKEALNTPVTPVIAATQETVAPVQQKATFQTMGL